MEFHRYPMDVQTLRMQIAGYSYDDSQVKYEWSSVKLKEKDMTEFYVDKESLRAESTMFITGTHTAVVAEFQVRRRLQHFIMGFYLPCITCTCASWIQFWMEPSDIAGRASVGLAAVLAEIFLLEFSNQGMPKVSYVKAAELFMVVSFTFIFSALVESAVVFKFCDVFRKRKMEDSEGDLAKVCKCEIGRREGKFHISSFHWPRFCLITTYPFAINPTCMRSTSHVPRASSFARYACLACPLVHFAFATFS
ncbi:PREDICTED: glycine receptor subunit alpha-1-like [Acropora digitifera]|uniref:glycine receptor subunit alpha-1-like n=1 Tax=Acropora digitifera TaxID=70779 RepID=UPI00077A8949|nr:PREDICTED: glycine receptor subunit alpha-1-like [Acropora digitifera]